MLLVVITPGLTTITVEWHNETFQGAKIDIIIENPLYYRVSTCYANQGSRVIRSMTPSVTYTVPFFYNSGVLPTIGKVILFICWVLFELLRYAKLIFISFFNFKINLGKSVTFGRTLSKPKCKVCSLVHRGAVAEFYVIKQPDMPI